MPNLPTEVWVAILSGIFILLGYFIRPIGDFIGTTVSARRAEQAKRGQFQFETLVQLGEGLEAWAVARRTRSGTGGAIERVRLLAFRVKDDQLRARLEELLADPDTGFEVCHGNAVRRLGEVLREM